MPLRRSRTQTPQPTPSEVRAAQRVAPATVAALKCAEGQAQLRLRRGRRQTVEIEIPASVVRLVGYMLDQVRHGHQVPVPPRDEEVSPAKAASILQVSRPFAQRLMDEGKIPSRLVGRHRRAPRAAVEAYRKQMQRTRAAALDEAIGDSRALGFGYDV